MTDSSAAGESTHSQPLGVPSEPAEALQQWIIYCHECAKPRDATGKADGWLLVWRHECSVVVSIRPWDQTVAVIPDRPSFCSWQCALPRLIKLGREAQVLDSPECPYCNAREFTLTPPKPKPSQTSFRPEDFDRDDDATGFKR